MLPGKTYSADEILRTLLRRRWWLLLPAVLGLTAGVVASSRLPEKYRSETLILVVPPRIPQEIMPRNPETVADRLNTINEVILSRSRLERIIRDLNLYEQERAENVMEDLVVRMRNEIKVSIEGKESFRVSYVSDTAKTAQMATDRLASLYIDENLKDQEKLAQNTNQFLESQLEEARRRLAEQEKKLEAYKNAHAGQLPSQQPANLQSIQNAQLQLQSISESTNRARERRILIERQLADAETMPIAARPADGAGTTPEPAALTTTQQLEAAQARLSLFKQRYTPDHPDIRGLERTIGDLQKKLDEEGKQAANAPPVKSLSPAEAMRQRQISELRAQLEAIDLQISSNQREESRLKGVMADYQMKVNAVPARESELVELTRDYTTLNDSYNSLLKQREAAKLNENLVRRQITEQFKVLDAASMPQKPYNSMQRLGILLAGPLGGLALGLALVAFFEYRDSSFKSEDEVERLLTVPVLALVPLLMSDHDRKVRRRRTLMLETLGTIALLTSVGAAIAWRLWS